MSGIGTYLLHTALTLAVASAVAALLLGPRARPALRRLVRASARGGKGAGAMELLQELTLDRSRSIYLVRIEDRRFVIGGTAGGLTRLGELGSAPAESAPDGASLERPSGALGRAG